MELLKNYRAVVSYDGSRYAGWQKQNATDSTIQGKLEAVLSRMCDAKVEVIGSGRTDAGVHAKGQVINFFMNTEKTEKEILTYLNHYLPEDIVVLEVTVAPPRFHSRLSAKGKIYSYHVWVGEIPPVFQRKYVYVPDNNGVRPNVAAMKKAAEMLVGEHDFRGCSSLKKTKKSTIRTIKRIEITETKEELIFLYEGDGFLYHMIRILTGTLLEIGWRKRSTESIFEVLESGVREKAGYMVPPEGLCLEEVLYEV